MAPAAIEAGGVAGDEIEDYYAEVRAWRNETAMPAAKVAALEALRQKPNDVSEMKDACPITQARCSPSSRVALPRPPEGASRFQARRCNRWSQIT